MGGENSGESEVSTLEAARKEEEEDEGRLLLGSGEEEEELHDGQRLLLGSGEEEEGIGEPFTSTFTRRIKDGLRDLQAPHRLRQVSNDLLLWARSGSPFRLLLLTTVGIVMLLALSGLLFFMVFFLVATLNAIIVAFLISLAAAGGMLAIFFALLAAIYVGAVSTAMVAISCIMIFTMIAGCVSAGWICFFWIGSIATSKSIDWVKKSLMSDVRIFSASPAQNT